MSKPEIGKRIGLRSDSILVIQTRIAVNIKFPPCCKFD